MDLQNTVEFTHVALCLIPKILDPVDMIFLVCKKLRVINAEMLEFRDVQHVVTSPAVRINDAVWDMITPFMRYLVQPHKNI